MSPSLPIDTGVFGIGFTNPNVDNKTTIHFTSSSQRTTHGVLLGLTALDTDRTHNARVSADVLNVSQASAQINLRSWGDTVLYASTCNWLAVPSSDPDFQFGHYTASRDSRDGFLPAHTSHRVQFSHPYTALPKVSVWLSGIDCSSARNLRFRTFATDVTPTGFILHLNTWYDTQLQMLSVTWLAHPLDRADIFSGTVDTQLDSDTLVPKQAYGGTVEFDGARFARPPKVFMALNALDISNEQNQRVKISADTVTSKDMKYRIEAWMDTALYGAGFAYVAIADSAKA